MRGIGKQLLRMKSKEIDTLTFDQKIHVLVEISARLGLNKSYVSVSDDKVGLTFFKSISDTDTIYEKLKSGEIASSIVFAISLVTAPIICSTAHEGTLVVFLTAAVNRSVRLSTIPS